jgi:Zn-dependent peptidase ImmA (M78 family)
VKRPTYLKVFGQKYKIKYDYASTENFGMTDQETNTIHIRGQLQEDKIVRVFMHEITHAILNETPYSLRKRFDVEEVCDIVGYFLMPALKDNPHIVDYIFSDTTDKESNDTV